MPCDTRLKPKQTIQQRAAEVRSVVSRLDSLLVSGRVKVTIGPQGAVAFTGWADNDRDSVTDACAYRRIMATGSGLARAAIQRAELMSGRKINAQAVASGIHTHDGGRTWHGKG